MLIDLEGGNVMSSLQKMTTNLCQVLRLHEYRNSNMPGLEKLGAIDIYYLEAIYQLKDPTIGTISKLLGQSTPNTNYHIKKLLELGLIQKRLDDADHRVTHLSVTDKYHEALESNSEFWKLLQNRLEETVSVRDMAVFQRILRQLVEVLAEETTLNDF